MATKRGTTLQESLGHTPPEYKAESRPVPRKGTSIRGAATAYAALQDVAASEQEVCVALLLDTKYTVIRRVIVGVGTLAAVDVHPRECFREAVRSCASAIIVAHNHPSGDPEPSMDDFALTTRLRDAGKLLGIPLLDHLVVCKDGYISLADRGAV